MIISRLNPVSLRSSQRGSVLMVCLSLMLVLTIWGISSTRNTISSSHTVQNARMKQVSFEAAEFAVRQIERLITADLQRAQQIPLLFNGTNGRYSLALDLTENIDLAMLPGTFDFKKSSDWLTPPASEGGVFRDFSFIEVEYNNDSSSRNYMERQPRAIVEFMGRDDKKDKDEARYVFRITAIGWDYEGIGSSVVRTHYAIAF